MDMNKSEFNQVTDRAYLPVDPEFCHGIHDTQERRNGLRLLPDLGLVHLELQSIVLKIPLDLFAIYVVHVQVRDSQDASPMLVAVGQLRVLWIKHAIQEGEIVRNLLVAVNMETGFGL